VLRLLRRLWKLWSDIDTIGSLPAWFQWIKTITAAALAATSGYFAWAQHVPVAFAIPAVILTGGGTFWLWNQWLARRLTHAPTSTSPRKASLSEADERARERVAVLVRANGERAFSQLAALVSLAISGLREGHEDCEHTLAVLLDRDLERHQATASRLTTAINASDKQQHSSEDIQRLFGEFYRAYQEATTRLNDIGHVLGSPPQSLHRYREWRDTDTEFLRQLNLTIAYDGLEVLRGEVQAVGWGETQRPQQL
jgi:hypothetical protein